MSLVGKLENVKVGQVLLLKGDGYSAVGYLESYSADAVKLSTELPYLLQDLEREVRVSMFGKGPTKVVRKSRWYNLEPFDSFEILEPKVKN